MQRQGLLGRQAPRIAKPLTQVAGAELPERGVPSRAVPGNLIRARRDVPALDHFLQKAALEQPLPMGAAQVTGPDRDKTAPLQPSQGLKGFSQLFFRACHVTSRFRASATSFTGFRVARIAGY